jgi:hypothetical protein
MAAADDLDEVVKQYHLAAREFVNGNPEPYKMVFSHRDDVSVANPFGPVTAMEAGRCDNGARCILVQRWRVHRL